jgi:cell division protein FtsW (lipid II flippase)
MISLTLYLYASSVLTVGLLAAFAVHNQKSGWKKSRISPYQDRRASSLKTSVQDVEGFSFQLINLRNALGNSAGVMVGASQSNGENEAELVAVGREVSHG